MSNWQQPRWELKRYKIQKVVAANSKQQHRVIVFGKYTNINTYLFVQEITVESNNNDNDEVTEINRNFVVFLECEMNFFAAA